MLRASRARYPPAAVGDTVIAPIPDVDRGRGDPRNVTRVVIEVTEDNLYRLGNKQGQIYTIFSRNMFTKAKEKFLSAEEVPDIRVPLRPMATAQSLMVGEGCVRCACRDGCKATSKCKNRTAQILCNSKCQGSLACTTK
ncbi:Coadhesin [Frankliniella fusca]|uniref:Coadhesin n=1 Tax=Frankliniella fusca TaxID=407009 RepID=A0AAE1HGX6_9NEOP|nr:Coadhesin [Frankliniella fusca]